jgi:uncharacterized membrane protein required for colicin V production
MGTGLTIDLIALTFVVLLAVIGWYRGLISQAATIGAAVGLWFTTDLWAGPVGDQLAFLGDAFAEHGFLRRMTAGLLLYFAIVLGVMIVERLVVQRFGPLKLSNHWAGSCLGAAKGVVYGAIAIWTVQTIALWEKQPDEEPPAWLSESKAAAFIAPYNPVRLFSLQELIAEAVERVQQVRNGTAADDPTEASVAAGDGEPRTRSAAMRRRTRRAVIEEAPPVKVLIDDASEREGLREKSWTELARDPRVRRILADPKIRDLLYGS